jgi:50S ribosomal subunit-associated GTPase HflX
MSGLCQRQTFESPLDELARLAETAGATVVGNLVQRRRRPQQQRWQRSL